MELFLISGLSGSGKSVALKMLEDSGYYCVDNLHTELLAALMDNLHQSGYAQVAVSVDVRSGSSMQQLPRYIEQLEQGGTEVHLLFLDARNETLVKRFSETPGRQSEDADSVRVRGRDVERLTADRARRSEQRDSLQPSPRGVRGHERSIHSTKKRST